METKEAYEKKIEAQLDQWRAEIEELKTRADKAEAEARVEYYQDIEKLQSMQEALRQKLYDFRNAGDDAWKDIKGGIDSAIDTFGDALKSAASRFKQ